MATIGTLVINIIGDSSQFRDSIEESIKTMQRAERQVARSARNIEKLGQGLMIGLTAPLMLISGYATKAAIDWEDAFAGVRKTVEGTEEQLAELARGIRDMAREIPTAATEVADIAAMAGQLGIQREAILGFTRTMADLAVATDLAGEQGATALAQFANVMQMSQRNFDRLGSTIVALGNNAATTESRIAEFGQRIAAAGRIAGMAEAEVLAIGAAMASVGVEAEAGGTAVQKMLIAMTQAVAQGNDKLSLFAATAGMSAQQFATLWREDAAQAFTAFVEGLGRAGDQAFVILQRLGMTDSRLMQAFLSLGNAGNLLRRTIELGNRAWEENNALAAEAAERYRT
ncbi:MAG: phage tail tape measure protein, partial [Bacillaceae bacterium]|nr:phage tail tape measure protein [Bacillaceae bacterium]